MQNEIWVKRGKIVNDIPNNYETSKHRALSPSHILYIISESESLDIFFDSPFGVYEHSKTEIAPLSFQVLLNLKYH